MLNIQVRIVRIDHDGFNGRDYHPGEEHVGKLANVLSITVLDEDGMPSDEPTAMLVASEGSVRLFTCSMVEEPELLQLMEHEIEFVSGLNYKA